MLSLCVALTMAMQQPSAASATIDDFRFLTGTWSCDIWGGQFEETWSTPIGETMQGFGRHISGGKVGFMEFMSIEKHEGVWNLWMVLGSPSKGPKTPMPFKLVEMRGKTAVFANPTNDYPSRILYTPTGPNAYTCRTENDQKGEDFHFVRKKA